MISPVENKRMNNESEVWLVYRRGVCCGHMCALFLHVIAVGASQQTLLLTIFDVVKCCACMVVRSQLLCRQIGER